MLFYHASRRMSPKAEERFCLRARKDEEKDTRFVTMPIIVLSQVSRDDGKEPCRVFYPLIANGPTAHQAFPLKMASCEAASAQHNAATATPRRKGTTRASLGNGNPVIMDTKLPRRQRAF